MTLKQWCLKTAKLYRERNWWVRLTVYNPPIARGICVILSSTPLTELSLLDNYTLRKAIAKLPNCPGTGVSYKWPRDDSGFDLRADWLEKFAGALTDPDATPEAQ